MIKQSLSVTGGLACLGFFFWTAAGCCFPRLEGAFSSSAASGPIALSVFFFAHSLLSGSPSWVYLPLNAVLLWIAMLTWQSSGVVVWSFGPLWLNHVELAIYLVAVVAIMPQQAYAMTGFRTSDELVTSGIYRLTRHPMHVLLIAFLTLAPTMTLDRVLVLFGSMLYLLLAIPFEERRLLRKCGSAYGDYLRAVKF